MSVTRSLFFSKIRRASSISLASSLARVLFHMPRSSIHCMPKSRAAISQARPKSCVISSLITATLNGEFIRSARAFLRGIFSRFLLLLSAFWIYRAQHPVLRRPSPEILLCAASRIPLAGRPSRGQALPSDTHGRDAPHPEPARHLLYVGRAADSHVSRLPWQDRRLPENNAQHRVPASHTADRRQQEHAQGHPALRSSCPCDCD